MCLAKNANVSITQVIDKNIDNIGAVLPMGDLLWTFSSLHLQTPK